MKMKHILVGLIALWACYSQSAKLNRVLLDDPLALCLDGSPGAYYVQQGINSKQFVLYFEGGGWCGAGTLSTTLQSCYQRSKDALGSSKSYPAQVSYSEGILSNNVKNEFRNMTKVFLKYCDGSGHQGSRSSPISYKSENLYFRGSNITIGQFDSLEKKFGFFSSAEKIIVSGGSAGGLAAFLWTEYVKQHAKVAKVYGVPDSGIFLDSANYNSKLNNYRLQFQNLFKLSNVQTNPPTPECVRKFPNQKHRCMFAENIYQEITAPIFPVNSLYDTWSIPNILGIRCLSGSSLQNCHDDEKNYIQQYHRNTSNILFSISSNPKNGFWAPNCANHVYMFSSALYNENFRIPMESEHSIMSSLASWVAGEEQQYHRHIDSGTWPDNKPCSGIQLELISQRSYRGLIHP